MQITFSPYKNLFIFILSLFAFISCNSGFEGTTIHVDIQNAENHLLVLEDVATLEKVIVDSTYVQEGKAEFHVYINDGIYRLRDNENHQMIFVYIGKNREEIEIQWDVENTQGYTIKSHPASQQIKSLAQYSQTNANEYTLIDSIAKKDSISAERVEEMKSANRSRLLKYIESFVDTAKNGDVAAFALNYVGATPENINFLVKTSEKIFEKYPDARYAQMWYESMELYRQQLLSHVQNGLSIGTYAPQFEMTTLAGDTFSLKQNLGQYILLDFWASWCQPCRKENPTLVKAYKQFKNRKFTIVSISLDSQKDQWQKGIEVDKLTWPSHISDLMKWRSPLVALYEVKGIPASFLIDPSGKIIARDLRGNALIQTLDNILPAEMMEMTDSLGNVSLVVKYPEKKRDSTFVIPTPPGPQPITAHLYTSRSEIKAAAPSVKSTSKVESPKTVVKKVEKPATQVVETKPAAKVDSKKDIAVPVKAVPATTTKPATTTVATKPVSTPTTTKVSAPKKDIAVPATTTKPTTTTVAPKPVPAPSTTKGSTPTAVPKTPVAPAVKTEVPSKATTPQSKPSKTPAPVNTTKPVEPAPKAPETESKPKKAKEKKPVENVQPVTPTQPTPVEQPFGGQF